MDTDEHFEAHAVEHGRDATMTDAQGDGFLSREAEPQGDANSPATLPNSNDTSMRFSGAVRNPTGVKDEGRVSENPRTWQPAARAPTEATVTVPLPTIISAFRRAATDQDDLAILESVRQIAGAPPPFDFPTDIAFRVAFPRLEKYLSVDGMNASNLHYWEFTAAHSCGRDDIWELLAAVSVAGVRCVGRRNRIGNQSPEAFLNDLRLLAGAVFRLNDLCFFARNDQPWKLQLWRAEKMEFVVDCMLAVIDGEKAYYGTRPLAGYLSDSQELQLLRDRFDAVIERVVHWPKYITAGSKLTGLLIIVSARVLNNSKS